MRRARLWLKERAPRPVRRMTAGILGLRHRGLDSHGVWQKEIDHEANYWRGYFASEPADVPWRTNPDSVVPRSSPLYDALQRIDREDVTILDVGAGPLTPIGHSFPGKRLSITAIDPLAEKYDHLLAEVGIVPPVRTVPGEGEHLLDTFAESTFDIACSMNALDHTYDPLLVIRNMVEVVKPGGFVVLHHRANEAEAQLYRGLHQWNLDCQDGAFVIWNRSERHDVGAVLGGRAPVECHAADGGVSAIIEKRR